MKANVMQSNPRYKNFRQKIFTAGDYEQFVSSVRMARKTMKTEHDHHVAEGHPVRFFRYGDNWLNTFSYIFEKLKKGIYVQIIDNDVNVFLPFSNVNYCNDYPEHVFNVNPEKYKGFSDLCRQLCEKEGRVFSSHKINRFSKKWYCNNGLIRYEFPIQENDSGIDVLYSMLKTLCQTRKIADCEFFLNKRDFPMLKRDFTDPYEALVGEDHPLAWDDKAMIPIISMCSKNNFADMLFPTWEDWTRASYQHDPELVFLDYKGQFKSYPEIPYLEWKKKKSMILFRGASTGLGVDCTTNPRLFYSKLALDYPDILNVGITKWNLRPRKSKPSEFLDIIHPGDIPLLEYMTPAQQSEYRYILHLPGHSCAYRLSYELSMNCVLLIYPCEYKLWFSHLLIPYTHYIPLDSTLSGDDILKKFEWCEQHPEECALIAKNAKEFYDRYLRFDAILDYCQNTLKEISSWMQSDETNVVYHDLTVMNNVIYEQFSKKYISDRRNTTPIFDITVRESHNTLILGSKKDGTRIVKINKNGGNVFHEFLVGKTLSCLSGLTPCFIQVCELYAHDRFSMEFNAGSISLETFLDREDLFSFSTLCNIFQQIVLSLRLAQRFCGFMHFDLCPWNILLYRNETMRPLYFRFPTHDVELQTCPWIVKIIDFDKSHIVCHDRSFQNSIPFFRSEIQDVKCFWFHCASVVLHKYRLLKHEMNLLVQMIELLSQKKFSRIGEVKMYIADAKKYANLCKPMQVSSSLLDFRFVFKGENVIKRPNNNTNLYQRVVEKLNEVHDRIGYDDKDLFCDDEDLWKNDYLRPIKIQDHELFPMFSSKKDGYTTNQYSLIYKMLLSEQSNEIPNLKKKISQYFNLI